MPDRYVCVYVSALCDLDGSQINVAQRLLNSTVVRGGSTDELNVVNNVVR